MNNFNKSMKKAGRFITAWLLAFFMAFGFIGVGRAEAAATGFYVNGTTLCDANGNAFVMRGINVAHAWYTGYTETSLRAIAATGANTVRVVVSDGAVYSKTSASELSNIIEMCKANKLICILEVHDATGSDSFSELNQAVNYWIEMKPVLNGNEQYVILNIANEWYGTWDGSAWAEGNKSAIRSIRNAGINHMIMVDCAGWGQYPDSIRYYGRSVFEADSKRNTVFSIHMYEYAGGNAATVRANIDNALNIGVPVVIGEFAAQHTNGDVDEATIMSYCTTQNVGYIGWSWKGNNSDLAYLDIAGNWDGTNLSSWGNTLINGANGIRATSQTCSVFNGTTGGGTGGIETGDPYKSLFWGTASASSWEQAVSVMTAKNGGSFSGNEISSNGYFYVEYSGDQNKLEFILQSWSGGANWAKVQLGESGTANGHYYAKYFYNNCVSAFGTNDFGNKLDQVHVGAMDRSITVYSVCYCWN